MNEMKIWILGAVVTVLGGILFVIGKMIANGLVAEQKETNRLLRILTTSSAVHSVHIEELQRGHNNLGHQIREHDGRLRDLERYHPLFKKDDHKEVEL